MIVNPDKPFQIVYPIFEIKDFTYLIESYVVQLNDAGKLTLRYQNISSKNWQEFEHGLDATDIELIKITDLIQADSLNKRYNKNYKKENPLQFLFRLFKAEKPTLKAKLLEQKSSADRAEEALRDELRQAVSRYKEQMLPLLRGKMVFEQNKDGNPVGKRLIVADEPLEVKFYFELTVIGLRFQPRLSYKGSRVKIMGQPLLVLNEEPGWIVIDNTIFELPEGMSAKKVARFFTMDYQVVQPQDVDKWMKGFVFNTIKEHQVESYGFKIDTLTARPVAVIQMKEVIFSKSSMSLFATADGQTDSSDAEPENDARIQFELKFKYGEYEFKHEDSLIHSSKYHAKQIDLGGGKHAFTRFERQFQAEAELVQLLRDEGLTFTHGKLMAPKGQAAEYIDVLRKLSLHFPISVKQENQQGKRYFIGASTISVSISERTDWFEVTAVVKFGPYEIPFYKLRKYILQGKEEFELPNGEIAIIPQEWFTQYLEVFTHANGDDEDGDFTLGKQYITLVQELEAGNLATVKISERLKKLRTFEQLEEYPLPTSFKGELRPYQKAGYDWMMFLNSYNLGGCLADDMGLGKTVQTLALLAQQVEQFPGRTSLLVMPTSLVYNWEREAKRFVPNLRILNHTGTTRNKNVLDLTSYDLILTSYGTLRSDIQLFSSYYFHYIILDESQAIKNPSSIIGKAVLQLRSAHRLILTGTPIENSTMDLWSQMNFVNNGLLGTQTFFKRQYLLPIEKKGDMGPLKRLHSLIKPFILRRNKSQVATELPEKIENLQYCSMSEEQEKLYEEAKAYYRNQIMNLIEEQGVTRSRMSMLRGLTHLRQLANHPAMVDPNYTGSAGKLDDVFFKIEDVVSEDHKILVFSQFVKHLTILRNRLDAEGIKYAYLDGSTKDRKAIVDDFQTNTDTHVFLISLKAGGVGLNLTAADYVFILDPWWNPAAEAQAVDRAHRIGQVNTVFTYKFITQNTVEEKILALQEKKKALIRDLISTEESFVKSLTKEDIEEILG